MFGGCIVINRIASIRLKWFVEPAVNNQRDLQHHDEDFCLGLRPERVFVG